MRKLYEEWRALPGSPAVPPFDEFWEDGGVDLPQVPYDDAVFSEFRADPDANPLQTPSGKIEIYSETFASFGQPDVPPHASLAGARQLVGLAAGPGVRPASAVQPAEPPPAQPAGHGTGQPVDQGRRARADPAATPTTPPPAG